MSLSLEQVKELLLKNTNYQQGQKAVWHTKNGTNPICGAQFSLDYSTPENCELADNIITGLKTMINDLPPQTQDDEIYSDYFAIKRERGGLHPCVTIGISYDVIEAIYMSSMTEHYKFISADGV